MVKLSAIMTVYNGEAYLKEAIDSVLSQSFADFEFIIINDGSTDNSSNILNQLVDKRIKIIHQENTGAAKARNTAIDHAVGEYIAIIDADDICLPERFKAQVDFLSNNNDYIMVGSNAIVIDAQGNEIYTSTLPTSYEEIKKKPEISHFYNSSVCFRKKSFYEAGKYDLLIKNYAEDLLLWHRMTKIGKIKNISDALIKYRINPFSVSLQPSKTLKKAKILITKALNNSLAKNNSNLKNSNLSPSIKKALYYERLAQLYLSQKNNRKLAFKYICKSLYHYPTNFRILRQFAKLLIVKA